MPTDLTDADLAAIEQRHVPFNAVVCRSCRLLWPCDAARLVAAVREGRAKLALYEEQLDMKGFTPKQWAEIVKDQGCVSIEKKGHGDGK